MVLLQQIKELMLKNKLTISCAESCTGGLLGSALTDVPGSSRYFKGGIVAYSNFAKIKLFGIAPVILKRHGAVSHEVTEKMAKMVRKLFHADIGIAITGIAGPTGGTKEKPVGTVYIAISYKSETLVQKFLLKGERAKIKKAAVRNALKLLPEVIKNG